MLHAVIMAGGSGTRFWPLSRRDVPKQFLSLTGDRSLIQQAFDRCQPMIPAERCWVVTNERMFRQTAEHLPELPRSQILCEPCARNTAPCVGLAAACLLRSDPNAVMLVMPADHVIGPIELFQSAVKLAQALVTDDPRKLVLFGVPPTYPSTGFGYIERGSAIEHHPEAYSVVAFREKPDRPTAESYLRAGTFYWNCGIFVWRADRILEAIAAHEPEMARLLRQLAAHYDTSAWGQELVQCFPKMKSISIDYAVLEREPGIAVVEAPFAWDDVGSWQSLERLTTLDVDGNAIVGLHRGVRTSRCIVRSTDEHLVATLGVSGLIVVHTPEATLVASRDDENAVREIVALLEQPDTERFL